MNANGEWAIVELYGHIRMVGYVTEVEKFGAKMGRVDIPFPTAKYQEQTAEEKASGAKPIEIFEASPCFGGGSVFRYTPCTEEVVRRERAPYSPPARLQLRQHDPEDEQPESEEEPESSDGGPGF